jgi:hypothetical protein
MLSRRATTLEAARNILRTSRPTIGWEKIFFGPKLMLDGKEKSAKLRELEVYGCTLTDDSLQGGDPVPGLPGSGESAVNPDLMTAQSIRHHD